MAYRTEPELFVKNADVLKIIAHPQRLCIVKTLCEKDHSTVTDMQECLGEVQSTVSQHLAKLKSYGIITGKREGTFVYYSIASEEMRHKLQGIIKELFQS